MVSRGQLPRLPPAGYATASGVWGGAPAEIEFGAYSEEKFLRFGDGPRGPPLNTTMPASPRAQPFVKWGHVTPYTLCAMESAPRANALV